jgi:hypothetical protein
MIKDRIIHEQSSFPMIGKIILSVIILISSFSIRDH